MTESMDDEKYMEMVVDHYDGNLDEEGERLLAEATSADPSKERMYRLYGESLSFNIAAENTDTEKLRRRIVAGTLPPRSLSLGRAAAVAAAVIAAAVVLTVTMWPRHDRVYVAMVDSLSDISPYMHHVSDDIAAVVASDTADESRLPEATAAEQTVTAAYKAAGHSHGAVAEAVSGTAQLREVFMLARPLQMIDVEYDPADMLCGMAEMPGIDAGYVRPATGGGFVDKLSYVIRMLK